MTYTGSWFFKWRSLNIIALAVVLGMWYIHAPRMLFTSQPDYSAAFIVSIWLVRCVWLGILVLNVFRTYRMSFYFITDSDGGLTIRNALLPLPIARLKAGEIERADFKKTVMFYYKLQLTVNGTKTRWFGNDALKVPQWQALVDDLKAHMIMVEVENKEG